MRVLGYELNKLMNWKIIGLVVMISTIFYQLFLSFHIEHFPNGRPNLDRYNIAGEMITEYGYEMDEHEYTEFQQTYHEEVEKANLYLQSNEAFVEAEITTYEQFDNIDRDNQELTALRNKVMFEEGVDVFWELQAREGMMNQYEGRTDLSPNNMPIANENQQNRVKEVISKDEREAILPTEVVDNYNVLISQLAILIVLSVMIVVSRIHIIDQKNNMRMLQYTTHKGRYLFKKKTAASFLAALLITTIHLVVFFFMYLGNNVSVFFESSLHSFLHHNFYWMDFRFLDYILATVVAVFLLSFITAAIAAFISRVASRYITLIGAHVPVAVILVLLISEYLISYFMSINYPMYLTVTTYAFLIAIGISLLISRWKKEKKVDIV
ncbi:hypothetical protein SAMN05192534_1356 [Alteribacillus persepolensis]|uniref:ABC-2 family transporter protein n=1 Tax=Alteribacillus persepolensis TaxID=568899 RepID=A0A1G8JNK4_9BACI|nr:hypothetical protein [Alteribacillus persepolensis]SDI32824.1 hypothetical protein SAMN05192534_1356 [Alteribacillus persepolensis]